VWCALHHEASSCVKHVSSLRHRAGYLSTPVSTLTPDAGPWGSLERTPLSRRPTRAAFPAGTLRATRGARRLLPSLAGWSIVMSHPKGNVGIIAPDLRARVQYTAVSTVMGAPPVGVRETTPTGSPKPRLLDRVRLTLRARHGSRRTEKTGGLRRRDAADIAGLCNAGTKRTAPRVKGAPDQTMGAARPARRDALACPSPQRTRCYPVPYTSSSPSGGRADGEVILRA
jgi:hypothetical protein